MVAVRPALGLPMPSKLSSVTGTAALIPLTTAAVAANLPLPLYVQFPMTVSLLHAAACGFAVTAAASPPLCQHTVSMLGKDPTTGKFPLHSWLLFWPYHVMLRAIVRFKLAKNSAEEPLWTRITDELYIGGWPACPEELPNLDIAVLDCTCELPSVASPDRYLNIPVWDTTAPSDAQVTAAVRWALQQRARGRAVFVHCAHGHGRSCVVLCAVLVAYGLAEGYWDAFRMIKSKRPAVRLNAHQMPGLDAWYQRYLLDGDAVTARVAHTLASLDSKPQLDRDAFGAAVAHTFASMENQPVLSS